MNSKLTYEIQNILLQNEFTQISIKDDSINLNINEKTITFIIIRIKCIFNIVKD